MFPELISRKLGAGLLPALLLSACTPAVTAPPVAASAPAPAAQTGSGAAAANDPRASRIGQDILRQGGGATDAAIAMMFALSVVEPQSTGLGGGGFIVRGDAAGNVETIDGRETAPAAATDQWFIGPDGQPRERKAAILSGLSIGVPGNVALAAEAWRRHGKLPWADLVAPSIALARDGFPATPRLSGSLASFPERAGRDPAGKAMLYGKDGAAPVAGATVRLPELAATLEMIAQQGAESFYQGAFAADMAARIAADTPGAARMTEKDITGYKAQLRDPACMLYRLYRVCTMGPPSSGGYAVLAILKQLEGRDLAALGLRNPETWHVFIEAQRLAYADRARYIGDPGFVAVPLKGLLDPAYLAARAALIDPASTIPAAEPGQPEGAPQALATPRQWPEHGTTHFVAADGDGNMVSFTSTVEGAFGSGLAYRGFYLNNELTDFSFAPGEKGRPAANRVEGGKRPASSMSPTVVYDPQGKPLFVVGAAGGGLIPVQTVRAIIGVIDFRLSLRDALGLPFVMAVDDSTVLVEKGTWMEALAPQLRKLGHSRTVPFDQLLRTTGALNTSQGWIAAHDPRLDPLIAIPATPGGEPSVEAGFSEGQGTHE